MIKISTRKVTNPFSSAGGGVTFEQCVGATYLVSLLANDIPRGLDWGITKEIRFQQRREGVLLDDLLITGSSEGEDRKLAIQVKHNLSFSASDKEFQTVINDCWNTFVSSAGWSFDQEKDRLGIAIGIYHSKIEHLQQLLEWARRSSNGSDFVRLVTSGASSKEKQEYLQSIEKLLKEIKSDLSNDELWRFLRCLVIMHYDIENLGNRDLVYMKVKLLDILKVRDEGQASALFDVLNSEVAKYAKSSGVINYDQLRQDLPKSILLKDQANCSQDLEYLRKHSTTVLEHIRDNIGEKVKLSRSEIVNEIESKIKENEVVIISGEPMVGKSALMKLIAYRLMAEGQVFALAVERFSGFSTIESFFHNIRINNDLEDLLSAAGTAPFRCILIDGLDKATDEDRRRVLDDIIIKVRKYNEHVISLGSEDAKAYCWKLVFTCRIAEIDNIVSHLETRKYLVENKLKIIQVSGITKNELTDVTSHLPELQYLADQEHLQELLLRPLILDILTIRGISLDRKDLPDIITESWFMEWFWEEAILLAKGMRNGKGAPDKREISLIDIAKGHLEGKNITLRNIDHDALEGLLDDRFIIKDADVLKFSHDVFEDWALVALIKENVATLPSFLNDHNTAIALLRPLGLYALSKIEVKQKVEDWSGLLLQLHMDKNISPMWHQTVVSSLLFSPLLARCLKIMEAALFENKGELLCILLDGLRKYSVRPDPALRTFLTDSEIQRNRQVTAYVTVPIVEHWSPFLKVILNHAGALSDEILYQFSFIAKAWLSKDTNTLFRSEVARLCLQLLKEKFVKKDYDASLSYEQQKETKLNMIRSVIYASDVISDEVDQFIHTYFLEKRVLYEIDDIVTRELGWVPICKYLPKTAIEIFEKILCQSLKADHFGRYDHLSYHYGISSANWFPPSYLRAPFLVFLRMNQEHGLALIHKIVNHATRAWRLVQEKEENQVPILQELNICKDTIQIWGDEKVFCWYRYPSFSGYEVTCALMALEKWMNEELKKGTNANELFKVVLKGTESCAVVGVCASVALANFRLCRSAVLPILGHSAFCFMDSYRVSQDLYAESRIDSILLLEKNEKKDLLTLARETHRKTDLRSLVPGILFSGNNGEAEQLRNALDSFPNNVPVFYEHERQDEKLMADRRETCQIWSAFGKRKHYEISKTDVPDQFAIEFKMPEELAKMIAESDRESTERVQFWSFCGWAQSLVDTGSMGKGFTIEQAFDYIKRLDQLSKDDGFLGKDSDLILLRDGAIAAFAAGLIIHQWKWINENNQAQWCIDYLVELSRRKEPEGQAEEIQIFPLEYRRSVARALPGILLRDAKNRQVRKAIVQLSKHRNYEVKTYLFRALRELWSIDSELIWTCIQEVIKQNNDERNQERWRFDPMQNLLSVLLVIPRDDKIRELSTNKELMQLLEKLLSVTINKYVEYQRQDRRYNRWKYHEWNRVFFPIIANAIIRLPFTATKRFLDPIMQNWEKAPSMLEEFLQHLTLVGGEEQLRDKLAEIIILIGNNVLTSKLCKTAYYDEEISSILSYLVMGNKMIEWKISEWPPLMKMSDFIYRWCSSVGSSPRCFPALVRMLRSIGFNLMPEYGIAWLSKCMDGVSDHKYFFEQGNIDSSLAQLLNDSWREQKQLLSKNKETMSKLVGLVSIIAAYGDRLAIELQKSIQKESR